MPISPQVERCKVRRSLGEIPLDYNPFATTAFAYAEVGQPNCFARLSRTFHFQCAWTGLKRLRIGVRLGCGVFRLKLRHSVEIAGSSLLQWLETTLPSRDLGHRPPSQRAFLRRPVPACKPGHQAHNCASESIIPGVKHEPPTQAVPKV